MKNPVDEALQALVRDTRAVVAEQVRDGILETPAIGSRDLVGMRLRSLAVAEREDREMVRAAVMDLSIASAVWVVAIDLRTARHRVSSLGTGVSNGGSGRDPLG